MKYLFPVFLILLVTLLLQPVTAAEDPVASHRERYEEISALLKSCKVIKKEVPSVPHEQELKAWFNDGEAVKVEISTPGEHGWSTEEYYYDEGKMFFVFRISESDQFNNKIIRDENRFYFKGKKLIRWLGADKKPRAKDDDYLREEELVLENAERAFEVANGKPDRFAPDAETEESAEAEEESGEDGATVGTTEGKFAGVEQGDYFHFNLDVPSGDPESYFILNPDAETEKVIDNPEKFLRRKCRVTWKESERDIPEAGGKMQIKEITKLEWLK